MGNKVLLSREEGLVSTVDLPYMTNLNHGILLRHAHHGLGL